jgi:hypothetical protein
LPTFTFGISLLLQTELVARKQGHGGEKASAGKEFQPEILLGFRRMGRAARAQPNSEFGMWTAEVLSSFLKFRIPQSAFCI